jgi:hypothetical protein
VLVGALLGWPGTAPGRVVGAAPGWSGAAVLLATGTGTAGDALLLGAGGVGGGPSGAGDGVP